MKKSITAITALILILTLTLSLASCGIKSKIIGTWTCEQNLLSGLLSTTSEYIFNEDGTGSMKGIDSIDIAVSFDYTIDGGVITLYMEVLGIKSSKAYTYDLNGDTLTLSEVDGDNVVTLIKKA